MYQCMIVSVMNKCCDCCDCCDCCVTNQSDETDSKQEENDDKKQNNEEKSLQSVDAHPLSQPQAISTKNEQSSMNQSPFKVETIKEGWIIKKGRRKLGQWQERYFQLKSNKQLCYFDNVEMKGEKGVIPLDALNANDIRTSTQTGNYEHFGCEYISYFLQIIQAFVCNLIQTDLI